MELRIGLALQNERSLGELRSPRTWSRRLGALVFASALLATACSEEPTPKRRSSDSADEGDDTDSKDEQDEQDEQDDSDDPSDPAPSPRDAGTKPIAKPVDGGSTKPSTGTPAADAGASTPSTSGDAASGSVDPVVDGGSSDAGPVTSGPVTLPDPMEKGPYTVVKEINVGKGFENPPANANDRGDGAGCTSFVQSFGETPEAARDYALFGPDYNVELYTLYRPENMEEGKLYPIVSWANGTCAKVSGYDALLSHVASHGFIVIAAHSRYTASGQAQLRGVDFVTKLNDTADSPLYKRVDTKQVGVFGHSQGGGSTWTAASDARVKTSIVLNMTGSGTRSTPSFFITGDNDITLVPEGALTSSQRQTASAYLRFHKVPTTTFAGHITLMKEPERVYPAVAAWFRYHLLADDAVAKSYFVGADCKLCNKKADFTFQQKGLK
jgi:hypothetical protein